MRKYEIFDSKKEARSFQHRQNARVFIYIYLYQKILPALQGGFAETLNKNSKARFTPKKPLRARGPERRDCESQNSCEFKDSRYKVHGEFRTDDNPTFPYLLSSMYGSTLRRPCLKLTPKRPPPGISSAQRVLFPSSGSESPDCWKQRSAAATSTIGAGASPWASSACCSLKVLQ